MCKFLIDEYESEHFPGLWNGKHIRNASPLAWVRESGNSATGTRLACRLQEPTIDWDSAWNADRLATLEGRI